MKIGLDLSVIQTPHRMRGVGATAINFVNNLSAQAKQDHKFIIFLYDTEQEQALALLNLRGLDYEIRSIFKPGSEKLAPSNMRKLKKKLVKNFRWFRLIRSLLDDLHSLKSMYHTINKIYMGNHVVAGLEGLDVFLQFDQMGSLPKSRHIKKARILYDIIPYVMESDYLWSYKTARVHGDSPKAAARKAIHRKLYKLKTRLAAKQADSLFAISEHTKADFVKYMGIEASRIQVVHLGVTHSNKKPVGYPGFKHYVESSWGYLSKQTDLREKPFLLFVGGADPRRRLNDLVAAFNNLKARGIDIRLVMAGDTMKGARAIPVLETQNYLAGSSYLEDIAFLGFIDEAQKDWLYQHTLAFVYPSVYEGFGLPVLEAMRYGTPVITYSNTSITEIAGDAAIFSDGPRGITDEVSRLLEDSSVGKKYSEAGKKQAAQFSWDKTVNQILHYISE